jgi:hypothetical protein
MAENVVTRYDPHFHLGMRVMTPIWCFRGWQIFKSLSHSKPIMDATSMVMLNQNEMMNL